MNDEKTGANYQKFCSENLFHVDNAASTANNTSELAIKPTLDLKPEETGQNWLLRHLRSHLDNVSETALTDFVMQQDITIFRKFMTAIGRRQCLFITVEKHPVDNSPFNIFFNSNLASTFQDKGSTNPRRKELESNAIAEKELDRELLEQPDKPIVEKKPRKMRPTKRVEKTKKASKSPRKTKRSSDKSVTEEAKLEKPKNNARRKETTKDEEPVQKPQFEEPTGASPTFRDGPFLEAAPSMKIDVTLRWQRGDQIPTNCSEFIFLATRDEPNMKFKSELDRVFVVGYCRFAEKFRKTLKTAEMLLADKLDFERQVNLLLQTELPASERREKWQNPDDRFENFIADTLVHVTLASKPNEIDTMTEAYTDEVLDLESIESLLKSRVRAFTKTLSKEAVIQVKLELSLYEMKFLADEMYSEKVVERLQRIVTLFSVIFMLYHATNSEWIQKALFHCIELTARIISTNMHQRIWNLIYEDCEGERTVTTIGDEKHAAIMAKTKPILIELIDLCIKAIPEVIDEYICLENISQCLKIFNFIEEEFKLSVKSGHKSLIGMLQKLQNSIQNMQDTSRDMMFDRSEIESAKLIVRKIWSCFEESYFESALESGNYDTIRNVCLQLVRLNNQLIETLPKLDKFCRTG